MSPSNKTTLNREADPLAPLEHLLRWLMGATVHVALGVFLGLLAAHAMRHRHLHWSWATIAFALVLLARAVLAGAAATLGLATLDAAVRGRRWHGEDLQAGADLAEIAASRTTPLDSLRCGLRRMRSWLRSGTIAGWAAERYARWNTPWIAPRGRDRGERWFRGGELSVGTDRHGRPVSIELGGASGGTHTLVVGATGSGKTVTQTWIAARAIAHGMAAVVVDPKNDRGMRDQLHRAALAAGRRFLAWTPQGPVGVQPLRPRRGDRDRRQGARGRALHRAPLPAPGAALPRARRPRAARRGPRGEPRWTRGGARPGEPGAAGQGAAEGGCAGALHAYLDSLTPRQRSDLTGVRDRLAIMAESDVGRWLDPATPGGEPLDLLKEVRAGTVVYFSLQADSRPLLAQMLGSAIVQDLQTVVCALQERPTGCLVVIDEFSAVAAEHVARLFARARSAGVSLLLGTQELADLRLPGRETLLEQVLGNLTSLIAHRQVVPDSAELIARLAGSRGAWRTTLSSDGRRTRTRVQEHLVGPEEVASLPRGCAAVIRLGGRRGVAIGRMHSPG